MRCISLVGGLLVTATLYNLDKRYRLVGADIGDAAAMRQLRVFAARRCRTAAEDVSVGYCGGRCPMMFSMSVDEYALKHHLGLDVVSLPIEEFYHTTRQSATTRQPRAGRRFVRRRARLRRPTQTASYRRGTISRRKNWWKPTSSTRCR